MNASEQKIQAIKIEDADINAIEAKVEILEALESTPSLLEPYEGLVEHLYHLQMRTEEGSISATLYIIDDPEADLTAMKESLRSIVAERKNILRGPTQRNGLVRAVALQSRINELGKAIKFKEQLLNLPNPVLEKNKSKITASLI